MCSTVIKDRVYAQSPSSTVERGLTVRVEYRLTRHRLVKLSFVEKESYRLLFYFKNFIYLT